MSLDLYLKSSKNVKKTSTGIYIRDNGKTTELETIEQVKEHFPDIDTSLIQEEEIETNYLFDGNITHNLGEMAQHIPTGKYTLYQLLWRPEESGFNIVTKEYVDLISNGLIYMFSNKEELEKYNPDNGWGNFFNLLYFVQDYIKALLEWDGKEEITIYASR